MWLIVPCSNQTTHFHHGQIPASILLNTDSSPSNSPLPELTLAPHDLPSPQAALSDLPPPTTKSTFHSPLSAPSSSEQPSEKLQSHDEQNTNLPNITSSSEDTPTDSNEHPQIQSLSHSSLSEINHKVKQFHLCSFVSTQSPPFTCVQYIRILFHKLGASESFGNQIRNKNWELTKVLRIRNHVIKQLFLNTSFLKLTQIGKDQHLSYAEQNEEFLWTKIHKQNILISNTMKEKGSFIHEVTKKVIQIHKDNQLLRRMAPSQPFSHWMATHEEFLQWHMENFEIKGLNSSSPTEPYSQWMEEHHSFKQWHSQNFTIKGKAHPTFTHFLPALTSLQQLFASPLKICFSKWMHFSSQADILKLQATDFRQTRNLNYAILSSSFAAWKINHLEHKNSVLTSISKCYQESLQLLLQEKNQAKKWCDELLKCLQAAATSKRQGNTGNICIPWSSSDQTECMIHRTTRKSFQTSTRNYREGTCFAREDRTTFYAKTELHSNNGNTHPGKRSVWYHSCC